MKNLYLIYLENPHFQWILLMVCNEDFLQK